MILQLSDTQLEALISGISEVLQGLSLTVRHPFFIHAYFTQLKNTRNDIFIISLTKAIEQS